MTSKVYLTNGSLIKECPIGFSWTQFFFGFFVPICRSDWKMAAIEFVAAIFTWSLSNFVFMFMYNKWYISGLLDEGYTVMKYENYNKETLLGYLGRVNVKESSDVVTV